MCVCVCDGLCVWFLCRRHTELEAVQSTALQQLEQAKEELVSLQDQVDG